MIQSRLALAVEMTPVPFRFVRRVVGERHFTSRECCCSNPLIGSCNFRGPEMGARRVRTRITDSSWKGMGGAQNAWMLYHFSSNLALTFFLSMIVGRQSRIIAMKDPAARPHGQGDACLQAIASTSTALGDKKHTFAPVDCSLSGESE